MARLRLIGHVMDNPYQTGSYSADPIATGNVTPGVIQALAGTKPWVRFCSVMGFIGAGFMVLAGLIMMAGGVFGGLNDPVLKAAAWMPTVLGVIYIFMAAIYLIPSLKLWKYGSAILRLMSSGSQADLEQAMEQQRGFWKFVGIMMLITIGFMALAMVGGMAAGIAGATRVQQIRSSP